MCRGEACVEMNMKLLRHFHINGGYSTFFVGIRLFDHRNEWLITKVILCTVIV